MVVFKCVGSHSVVDPDPPGPTLVLVGWIQIREGGKNYKKDK
jgi:hypothetical protein